MTRHSKWFDNKWYISTHLQKFTWVQMPQQFWWYHSQNKYIYKSKVYPYTYITRLIIYLSYVYCSLYYHYPIQHFFNFCHRLSWTFVLISQSQVCPHSSTYYFFLNWRWHLCWLINSNRSIIGRSSLIKSSCLIFYSFVIVSQSPLLVQ